MSIKKFCLISVSLIVSSLLVAGCNVLSGETKIDEGIVIAPKEKIRSSTAMVALDLAEVKRGDRLEILEQAEVKTPTQTDEWYKVRTIGKDDIVGWIKARHVINKSVVDKINELFDKSKTVPAQGVGHLKVRTKLRMEPGGETATYLSRGTSVEVVAKARTTFKPEKQQTDDADEETVEEPETRTVLWYQVRLPETEVLRAGWVGAQQVQLDVPDEILHLEGEGRRFTGWVVFDQVRDRKGEVRNNYIATMKSYSAEGPIDYTRLWVLIYAPDQGRYTGPYIEDGLRGVMPILVNPQSGRKGFTIYELDENGKTVPIEYEATRAGPSRLVVKRLAPKIVIKKQPKRATK
ncbi:MAG TPA: SH3 domain-containing protein [Blastocatellia bacterium]|nr:SH3 domain-containing protein [Blastocatellia bacterium]